MGILQNHMNKKGQGLSLTVIIVAALALIVLVVLVAIFVGRIGIFNEGVGNEGQAQLVSAQVLYGACHPTASFERGFINSMDAAVDDESRDIASDELSDEISRCTSQNSDQGLCESADCAWGTS
jgi:hypothetical protein